MWRTSLLLLVFLAAEAMAQDGGVSAQILDAGTQTLGFDVVQTPWGPGRKSAGENFRSTAVPLSEGPMRFRWNDFSLGFGGQYFARFDGRGDRDFNDTVGDTQLFIDHRARLSVRASAWQRFGVLLEFQDVRAWGSEPNTVTLTPNTGLHQGFVDWKPASFLDVRIGRQELLYGEDRLIGNLDWAQTARSFDGIFVRLTASPAVTLDAFGMVLAPPMYLVDSAGFRFHNSGGYFTGLYGRARFGKAGFDFFGLGLLEDPSSVALGSRHDNNRLTLGGRGFATFGGLSLVGEGAFQSGKVGQLDELVLAGAFAVKVTYTFAVWGSPYLLGEFTGASGDADPGSGIEHTFNQLFPTTHIHLGYMDYVAWQNVVHGHGGVGWRPWGAHVWLDVHHFRAWDPKGAWYAANGTIFVAADPNRTNSNMGTELDLSVTVPIIDKNNLALAGNFSIFLPGGEAPGTAVSTWGFLSVRSQF